MNSYEATLSICMHETLLLSISEKELIIARNGGCSLKYLVRQMPCSRVRNVSFHANAVSVVCLHYIYRVGNQTYQIYQVA